MYDAIRAAVMLWAGDGVSSTLLLDSDTLVWYTRRRIDLGIRTAVASPSRLHWKRCLQSSGLSASSSSAPRLAAIEDPSSSKIRVHSASSPLTDESASAASR